MRTRSLEVGLVPFLFGVADDEELSSVVLVRLLGDLGRTQSGARTQLNRMRRAGRLSAEQRGGRTYYRLAGPFASSYRRVRLDEGRPAAVWPGYFHALLYQVPESRRSFRDRLRRTALLLGYGQLQQGVLVAVEDHAAELAPLLDERPAGCSVRTVTIGMDVEQAARAALEVWDLPAVDRTLRNHVATLEANLRPETAPAPTAATLRRFAALYTGPTVDLLADPGLPPELLPADWCRPRLEALMREVRDRYLPLAATYLRSVTEAAGALPG